MESSLHFRPFRLLWTLEFSGLRVTTADYIRRLRLSKFALRLWD